MRRTLSLSVQANAPTLNPAPGLRQTLMDRHNWTTPFRLQVTVANLWLLSVLLALIVFAGAVQLRSAVKAVGQDSAPSILAALKIRAGLANMDANAANELVGLPGQNIQAALDYEQERKNVTVNLIAATENITYGDAERKPIANLTNGLAVYENWVTQARSLHERGDAAYLAAYRHAARLMQSTLLPNADALEKANDDAMTSAYSHQATVTVTLSLLGLAIFVALIPVLITTQIFLFRRTNRILNAGMLAATGFALLLLLWTGRNFVVATRSLHLAKEDAFDSIHALWQARSIGYDANGDESRWLLDRPLASGYEKEFSEKSNQIAVLPQGQSYKSLADQIEASSSNTVPAGFQGALAKELGNITFEGEKAAALSAVRHYGEYMALDQQIRQLANAGEHGKAVALCIGNDPGQSNWAFDQFDGALGETIQINQKAFDEGIKQGFAAVAGFDLLGPALALLIALAGTFGLRPRILEYYG